MPYSIVYFEHPHDIYIYTYITLHYITLLYITLHYITYFIYIYKLYIYYRYIFLNGQLQAFSAAAAEEMRALGGASENRRRDRKSLNRMVASLGLASGYD